MPGRLETLLIVIAAMVWLGLGQAAARVVDAKEQDGILATLSLDASTATLSWRFATPPPAPVTSVEASVDRRPAGTPTGYEAYPAARDVLVVEFLVDTGDAERGPAIADAASAVASSIAALPPEARSVVGAFDAGYRLLDPVLAAQPETLAPALTPRQDGGNLTGALLSAIQAAAAIPASRRAVFVYTDGYNTGTTPWSQVEAAARADLVSLTFVISPSLRLADLAGIGRIAAATGGRMLSRADLVDRDIRLFLMSGARVGFPLEGMRRYVWEPDARLEAGLHYGDKTLWLGGPVDVPLAGPLDTAAYLWRRKSENILWLGVAVLLGVVAVLALRLRRSRRRASGSS